MSWRPITVSNRHDAFGSAYPLVGSLRQRIGVSLLVTLATVLTLGGAAGYSALRSTVIAEFDYALLSRARMMTAPDSPVDDGFDLSFTEYPPADFRPSPRAEFFEVWSRDGGLVARSPSLGSETLGRPAEDTGYPRTRDVALPGGKPGRAVALRLGWEEIAGEKAGEEWAYVAVFARDTSHLQMVLRDAAVFIVGGGLVLCLSAAWLADTATRFVLRPVGILAEKVMQIDSKSLTTRVGEQGMPLELQPIVVQLDLLLSRLETAFQRERRFSANVAHELLTPVSEIRALAENAMRWNDDPEATARFASDVLDSAQQMERTTRTLLSLAREASSDGTSPPELLDLAALLAALRTSTGQRAAVRQLRWEWTIPDKLAIYADPVAVDAMIRNLLDNALEYTPAGGNCRCDIDCENSCWSLTVANTNPGLQPADLDHLFEPFWRSDSARMDRNHAGLGLALVRALADRHRMDLTARLADPNTLCITLSGACIASV